MSPRPRHALIVLALVTVAACGTTRHATHTAGTSGQIPASPMGAASAAPMGPGGGCGTVRSAANVLGTVTVRRGQVDCGAVRQALTAYYGDLAAGRAPGNGGGGPIWEQGWRCISGPSTAPGTTCTKGTAEVTVGYR